MSAPTVQSASAAATASTMDTLDFPLRILPLSTGNPTNALRPEVGVLSLNAAQAAKLFVAVSFPFRNQSGVSHALLQAPFVEVAADGFSGVEQVVNVAGALVVDLEDWPGGLDDSFTFVRFIFG